MMNTLPTKIRATTQVDSTCRKVLIIDDEKNACEGLSELIQSWGYLCSTASNGIEALTKMVSLQPDLIICDLVMPKMDGLALLKQLKEHQKEERDSLIIILTAQGSIDSAVEAMREGAYDYLTKPVDIVRLKNVLHQACEKAEILDEVKQLRQQLLDLGKFGGLIGQSNLMKDIFRQIELSAPTSAPVMINGESGTGKELVARALHEMSRRKHGPFIVINCAAIPATLLESEIFGHERGAFTGANKTKEGCFELANHGTFFLDEIAEMAPDLQSKLLRVLQDGTFRRVGGTQELRADVRIVAASNLNFRQAIANGKLREDLYYRLNVFCFSLPRLADRGEDISLLTQHFIHEFNQLHQKQVRGAEQEVLSCLEHFPWPGNVRELRNTLERAVILAKKSLLTLEDLPENIVAAYSAQQSQAAAPGSSQYVVNLGTPLQTIEYQIIQKTLLLVGGNKTVAAKKLGISLKTLHNKIKKLRN
jgi:DNA-binding NtrC family response regulator